MIFINIQWIYLTQLLQLIKVCLSLVAFYTSLIENLRNQEIISLFSNIIIFISFLMFKTSSHFLVISSEKFLFKVSFVFAAKKIYTNRKLRNRSFQKSSHRSKEKHFLESTEQHSYEQGNKELENTLQKYMTLTEYLQVQKQMLQKTMAHRNTKEPWLAEYI